MQDVSQKKKKKKKKKITNKLKHGPYIGLSKVKQILCSTGTVAIFPPKPHADVAFGLL